MDKALLTRATSKDDTPTPGYLYGEIARMTQHSYETCMKVQDFLIARVKKNKHHTVKYKALQVIKHVCREGRVDFKREMQKHIPTIKECLQFRGVPDPLKGDEYYRRVRESAKDCLDAIYDTDNTPGLSGMGMSARIQGVGANPNDNSGSGSGWSSKIWGGKSSNDSSLPPPPMAGAPISGYNGAAPPPGAPYGYPTDPNQGSYGGPQPYGQQQQQQQPYQPDYSQQGSYGGHANPPFGGAPPLNPYGGAAPPFHDQKLSGIGNPMYQDPRADEKGFFKGLKEKVASKYSKSDKPTFGGGPPGSTNPPDGWSFATNRGPTSGNYGGALAPYNPEESYRPTGFAGGGYRPGSHQNDSRESASSQLREKSYDGDRKKGRVGGAWTDADAPSSSASGSTGLTQHSGHDSRTQSFGGNTRGTNPYARNSDYDYEDNKRREPSQGQRPFPQAPVLTGQTSGAQSDGSYERNLVTALCAPGGMRAIPPKDKMDAFIKNAMTLDAEILGPILEDCLSDDQWTVVSKALATIDALLRTDGCEEFEEYFAENSSEIESCANSDKVAIRDRAVKVLHNLGLSAGPGAGTSSQDSSKPKNKPSSSHRKQPAAAEADLLGGFDDAPTASDNGSLFSGLQTNAPPQQSAQESAQPVATANDVTDMFGGLQLQSSTSSTTSAPESSQPTASAQVSAPVPAVPAPTPSAKQNMVLDPLLEPMPAAPAMNPGFGGPMNMNMNMMNFNMPQQMTQMQQMQQMQYMQQMQQMQQMQYMQQMQQMQGMGGNPGSQVIGAAMTPSGYIAKTIQEPTDGLASDSRFGFMKKKDDSFNFVEDAMKNS
ncbi:unnamed protein product [Peronospora farinosa]|uniref:ENTH domain-containing protein n=1 Tax=Peronospora farinosa TaxID=134698 RepID=A0ABN8C976_9STRA|nr:unnamed protein product [Peronospora farinosa]